LCSQKTHSGGRIYWDEESKKTLGKIRIACKGCVDKEVAAGRGEVRPNTETPAQDSAGASGLVTSIGGNEESLALLREIRDLQKETNALLRSMSGLIPQATKDFSPPPKDPEADLDLAAFKEEPEPDPNWLALLDRVEEINKSTFSVLSSFGKLESWTAEEVVISLKGLGMKTLNDSRKAHLETAVQGRLLTIKERQY